MKKILIVFLFVLMASNVFAQTLNEASQSVKNLYPKGFATIEQWGNFLYGVENKAEVVNHINLQVKAFMEATFLYINDNKRFPNKSELFLTAWDYSILMSCYSNNDINTNDPYLRRNPLEIPVDWEKVAYIYLNTSRHIVQ